MFWVCVGVVEEIRVKEVVEVRVEVNVGVRVGSALI